MRFKNISTVQKEQTGMNALRQSVCFFSLISPLNLSKFVCTPSFFIHTYIRRSSLEKLNVQRQWIDAEAEKLVREKEQVDTLNAELLQREEMLRKREELVGDVEQSPVFWVCFLGILRCDD